MKRCDEPGHDKRLTKRGWIECRTCRNAWYRRKRAEDPTPRMKPWGRTTDEERFFAKLEKRDDGCWIWTGARVQPKNKGPTPYPVFSVKAKTNRAHRWSYEHFVGPIPEGFTIDHLCRVTMCVNPAHLEAVENLTNIRRGKKAQQTHCIHGHEFTPENTIRKPNGTRACRECRRARRRVA